MTPRPVPGSGFQGWGAAAGTQGCGPRHLPVVAVILERREVLLELAVRLLQPLAELLEAVAERRLEGRVLRVHARAELRSALPIAALAPSPLPAPGAGLGRTWAGPGRGRSRGRELGRGRAGRRRRHSATRGPVAALLPGFPPGRGRPSPRSAAQCQPPWVLYRERAKLEEGRARETGWRAGPEACFVGQPKAGSGQPRSAPRTDPANTIPLGARKAFKNKPLGLKRRLSR